MQSSQRNVLSVFLEFRTEHSSLFLLRFLLFKPLTHFYNRNLTKYKKRAYVSERLRKYCQYSLSEYKYFQIREIGFSLFEDDEKSLNFLGYCLNITMKDVLLLEIDGQKKWIFVHKLLERTNIRHLEIDYSTLTNESL